MGLYLPLTEEDLMGMISTNSFRLHKKQKEVVDKGLLFRLSYQTFFEMAKNVRSKPVDF
jgi:hypothetical protein